MASTLTKDSYAKVFKARAWARWGCISEHAETVWHKSRPAAIADAVSRVGGPAAPHKIKTDRFGVVTVEQVGGAL
jgi:hypothetical protein